MIWDFADGAVAVLVCISTVVVGGIGTDLPSIHPCGVAPVMAPPNRAFSSYCAICRLYYYSILFVVFITD
jgi:hypothetical protein